MKTRLVLDLENGAIRKLVRDVEGRVCDVRERPQAKRVNYQSVLENVTAPLLNQWQKLPIHPKISLSKRCFAVGRVAESSGGSGVG